MFLSSADIFFKISLFVVVVFFLIFFSGNMRRSRNFRQGGPGQSDKKKKL